MDSNNYESFSKESFYSKDIDRLHFAMNAAGIGVWEVDIATNKVIWDDRCRELFGLAKNNIISYEEAVRYIHPDDVDIVNEQVQAALRGENRGAYHATYRTIGADDGKLRWVNFTGTAYFDEVGKIVRFGGVAQDVTSSYNSQLKTVEFQRQIISLLEQSSVAIAINVRDGLRFTAANAFYAELVGRKPEDIIGKPLLEALPELKGKGFDDLLNGVLNTGIPYFANEKAVEVMRGGKKETVYVNFAYHPLNYEDGELSSLLTVVTDVTPQVMSRIRIEESEARFRSLVEDAPAAMFIFRGENMIIDTANTKALEMVSRTKDCIGKPLLDTIPEIKGSPIYKILEEVYRTGVAHHGQEVLVPLEQNGGIENRYFNFAFTPFLEGGKVIGVMDVATEVTEQVLARKKIEEVVASRTRELAEAIQALQNSNLELQRSNNNLEEFAHAASHDLKEPIRKIRFFTQQLKEKLYPQLEEKDQWSFSRIENATERMGLLIDDLLLYAHVSQRPLEMEQIDLNQKVRRVLEDLELDIAEKKAVIHLGELPVIRGFRRQMQQLFQNLISNALKYSKADVPPQIEITAEQCEEEGQSYHVIHVKDNGIGFPQEYADRIFQMFTRLHGRNEYSGTGVGLSIVRKVLEHHGGFIRVQSEPGIGTRFSIYLPVS